MKKTIVVEGLPGSGKTTIAEFISAYLGYVFLPEHIFIDDLFLLNKQINNDNEGIFLLHWETKNKIAKLFKGSMVYDRNHLTTLSYNYAKSRILDNPGIFSSVVTWYKKSLKGKVIIEPDIYVILAILPVLCNKRKHRHESKNLLWSQTRALEFSFEFYNTFEDILKIDRSVHKIVRVDSRRPLKEVKRVVLENIENEI